MIFVSAADDKELVVRAFNEGGVDYVTKPFNHAELLSRVRTHLMLKSARDRLFQLAEDKDELLGILAHDLKNHLSGMQLSAQLLKDRMVPTENAKTLRLVDNMVHSTGQLLVFVKEFLANAALDHGFQLQRQRVNLAESLNGVVQEHQEQEVGMQRMENKRGVENKERERRERRILLLQPLVMTMEKRRRTMMGKKETMMTMMMMPTLPPLGGRKADGGRNHRRW